jgi:hypothetical protein
MYPPVFTSCVVHFPTMMRIGIPQSRQGESPGQQSRRSRCPAQVEADRPRQAILRDEQLRMTYDWLLAAAHHKRGLNSRRGSPIDRAIVLHRMGDLKHAFADIAQPSGLMIQTEAGIDCRIEER